MKFRCLNMALNVAYKINITSTRVQVFAGWEVITLSGNQIEHKWK